MKRVGRQDTAPELLVRRALHAAGFRFRLHVRTLPGTPDIVLPRYRTVVFVNGCFWHGHHCKHGSVRSKSNADFWATKIAANRARDLRKIRQLKPLGWHVECVWECKCDDAVTLGRLRGRLRARLEQR